MKNLLEAIESVNAQAADNLELSKANYIELYKDSQILTLALTLIGAEPISSLTVLKALVFGIRLGQEMEKP